MNKKLFYNETIATALLFLEEKIKENHYKEGHDYIQSSFNSLKESYPITAKRTMVNMHYANSFSDENLKSIAFILDEMDAFLFKHKAVERDTGAIYFNGMLAVKLEISEFTQSPEYSKEMILMDIASLIYALTA